MAIVSCKVLRRVSSVSMGHFIKCGFRQLFQSAMKFGKNVPLQFNYDEWLII